MAQKCEEINKVSLYYPPQTFWEYCGKEFYGWRRTFCSRSCLAKDKLKRAEIKEKLYSKETRLKISQAKVLFNKTIKGRMLIKKQSKRMLTNNPSHNPDTIEKMRFTKRLNGTLNIWSGKRGGNGELTQPQMCLSLALGWQTELVIPTKTKKGNG